MTTKKNAEIIVVRRLHDGIYKASGGGRAVVWSRHGSGPRSVRNAVSAHQKERYEAAVYYGNIGAGAGWMEVVEPGGEPGEGIRLDHPLLGVDLEYLPTPPTGGAPLSWWKEEVNSSVVTGGAF